MKFDYFSYTDKGSRNENQDALQVKSYTDKFVACVADGVGGGNCGGLASKASVVFFLDQISSRDYYQLSEPLAATHNYIKHLQQQNPDCQGMATTFTGCVIEGQHLIGVHAGDSRLCILRKNGIKQITVAHTEAARLVREGHLTQDQLATYPRRNVLDSAIGIKGPVTYQNFKFTLEVNDRVLLTTDGVHDVVSKTEFRDLSLQTETVTIYGNRIVSLLSTKKLSDNVSFIVIQVCDDEK